MALAIWDITTITSPTTLYGSAVRWVTIPDPYQAIGYMMTTTPVLMTSQYGLYFEFVDSSTPNFINGIGACTAPVPKIRPLKVRSYQKGTRSFVLDAMLDTTVATGVCAHYEYTDNAVKRLILYYRAMDEFGETPA